MNFKNKKVWITGASVVAQKIIRGVKNGKQEIYVGGCEVMGIYLKRFFPRLLSFVVRKARLLKN